MLSLNLVVSKLLSTLTLVAGLVWSSVCVAQCSIAPSAPQAHQKQDNVPPCHQKQNPQQQNHEKQQCPDPCDAPYAEAAISAAGQDDLHSLASPASPSAIGNAFGLDGSFANQPFTLLPSDKVPPLITRTAVSISILRV